MRQQALGYDWASRKVAPVFVSRVRLAHLMDKINEGKFYDEKYTYTAYKESDLMFKAFKVTWTTKEK